MTHPPATRIRQPAACRPRLPVSLEFSFFSHLHSGALAASHVNSAIGRLNPLTVIACQTTLTPAVSVRVSTFVTRKDAAIIRSRLCMLPDALIWRIAASTMG